MGLKVPGEGIDAVRMQFRLFLFSLLLPVSLVLGLGAGARAEDAHMDMHMDMDAHAAGVRWLAYRAVSSFIHCEGSESKIRTS